MADTNKFQTGISITFEEKAIVDEFQKNTGVSFSSTLGIIIREWAKLRQQGTISAPKAGVIKDGKVILDKKYWESEDGVEQSR